MAKSDSHSKKTSLLPKSLRDEEEALLFETDDSELPPSDIVAFNELRSCADLMRMYDSGQLTIKPDFQRDIVWTNPAQTRFVDSLVKELPIPSMCISLDHSSNKRLVIDGLQRMATIVKFLSEAPWKLSALADVDTRISGRRNVYIRDHYEEVYGRIENLTIPITVLRCRYSKPAHMKYLFTIFHRLNTGGSKLSNQEIRNCIFSGPLNSLLKSCAADESFRHLLGLSERKSYRFAYEELVLRFFAFTDGFKNYDGKLSTYLNDYMYANREPTSAFLDKKQRLFSDTISVMYEKMTDGASLPKMSKATIEALLVGTGRNVRTLSNATRTTIRSRLKRLLQHEEFQPENLKNALTTRDKMIARLNKSVRVLGGND